MKRCMFSVLILGLWIIILSSCNSSHDKRMVLPECKEQLVIYTSHKEEVYGPIIKEFEERTGIWVTIVTGGTNELLERIADESVKESSVNCDVMFGGGVENLEAYSQYFTSYQCKESQFLDKSYKSENYKWTAFSALPIVLIYNNKLVYQSVAPAGWKDLLQERWKGKIAFANPCNSGSSYTSLATLIQVMGEKDTTVLERFAYILDGNVLEGSGDVIDAVVKGTRLAGITLEETALKRIASGADIMMVYPVEGTSAVPDGSAIIKDAVHMENAEKFLDFITSKDVQQFLVDECYRRPARCDLIDEKETAEIKYVPYDIEWASSKQTEILKQWSEIIKQVGE